MPQVENAPDALNKLLEEVYASALKDNGGDKEKASIAAWTAAEQAGWKKDAEGEWVHEAKATVIAIKADNGDLILDVLGIPFGGPYHGRDRVGDYFSQKTKIHNDKFPEIPAVYAHGLDPTSGSPVGEPQYIGKAKYSHQDSRGHWYKVVLNKASEYAQKIWDAALKGLAGASSGAIAHLVRRAKDGHLDEWPAVEMTLVDGSGNLVPINPYAVALPALKAMCKEAGIEIEIDESKGGEPTQPTETSTETKGKIMTDEEKKAADEKAAQEKAAAEAAAQKAAVPAGQVDLSGIMESVIEQQKQQQAEAKAKQIAEQRVRDQVTELIGSVMKAAPANNGGAPALNLKTKRGDSENQAFWHYMRTGDMGAYKTRTILNEADDEGGGAIVPDDFYTKIVEKRDIGSVARQGGATVIQTSLHTVNIPVENVVSTAPTLTAESNNDTPVNYTDNEVLPFLTKAVTVLKYTRMVRLSEELLADQKANVEPFLANWLGRAYGLLENTLMHTALLANCTAGKTAANDTVLVAGDIWGLYYSLAQPYRQNAVWIMANSTEAAVRQLTGDPFSFAQTPQGNSGAQGLSTLIGGNRVFNIADMAAIAETTIPILFGDLSYLFICERAGLQIRRLNERFADSGEIGFLSSIRIGMANTQAVAMQKLTMLASS